MQAVWSRVKQTPGTCRHMPHAPTASSSARRARQQGRYGWWASGTPSRIRAYTTIFTPELAAGANARAKAASNQQWNKAFVRSNEASDRPPSTAASEGTEAAPTAAAVSTQSPRIRGTTIKDALRDSDWDVVQRIVGMDLADDHLLREQEALSQSTHAHNHHDTTFSTFANAQSGSSQPDALSLEWPTNTGHDLVRNNLPPQSLWAADTMRLTAMRRRHTWKKLAMQELSTGLLIHILISHSKLPRFFDTAEGEVARLLPQLREVASFSETQKQYARKEILERIKKLQLTPLDSAVDGNVKIMLHVDQPAMPRYSQDPDGDYHDICRQMNQGIKHILEAIRTDNDRNEALAIAKICHNLLTSTAPPNLETFNILLSGFRRWRRPQFVDNVIAALFAQQIRPNEVTCSEILMHYTLESRPDQFTRFVAKMRGVDDALMLANPNVTVNEASQGRLLRINEQKVLQKVHPTPMVFGALIHGVLRFAGFDRALDIYYEMKADGWGLDAQPLTRLLRDCVRRADWEGGLYLWEEINSIKSRTRAKDMAKAYCHMLSLCSITGNTAAFNRVLSEIAERGFERKSIIEAATRLTRWAHKKGEYLAPAFAADNVLIAISDYMSDTTSHSAAALATIDGDTLLHYDLDLQETDLLARTGEVKQVHTTSKEAWASWVEHEFGERPKDPEL